MLIFNFIHLVGYNILFYALGLYNNSSAGFCDPRTWDDGIEYYFYFHPISYKSLYFNSFLECMFYPC